MPTTRKKTAVKAKPKTTARAKTAVKKSKTAVTKSPKKTEVKRKPGAVTKKKRVTVKADVTEKVQITLPNRVPVRLQEKVLVLATTFERDMYKPLLSLSRVAGVCFIAIGATLAAGVMNDSSVGDCTNCSANIIAATEVGVESLSLTPLTQIPNEVSDKTTLPFEIKGAENVNAFLNKPGANGQIESISLRVRDLGNAKYEITINPADVEVDEYKLLIRAKSSFSGEFEQFSTRIKVGSVDIPLDVDPALGDHVDEVEVIEVVEDDGAIEEPDDVAVDEEVDLATTTEDFLDPEPVVTEVPTKENPPSVNTGLVISSPEMISGVSLVSFELDVPAERIRFFVRSVQNADAQFVGQASFTDRGLKLNTYNLPNGVYVLYANAILEEADLVRSNSVIIRVFNAEAESQVSDEATEQRELLDVTGAFVEETLETSTSTEITPVARLVNNKFEADKVTLKELFTAYSAAKQTDDPNIVQAAKESISQYSDKVVNDSLDDEDSKYIAGEVEVELSERFAKFQSKINEFEEIRRERMEEDSSIDSDSDGISDVDERIIYKTDPNNADSDGDGFTDGAEIVRGYDPVNAAVEAKINYQNPKETIGLESDKIVLNSVKPETVLANASTSAELHTVIAGKALPNSFVTLYIFSTPTVVTVRTDDTGAFEYIFTKELEDGSHQVFAAITDNAGEIISQSNSLSFVKEAQAFSFDTAEASGAQIPLTPVYEEEGFNIYQITVGMSVFALGVLLIMLGMGLRVNRPTTEQVLSKD